MRIEGQNPKKVAHRFFSRRIFRHSPLALVLATIALFFALSSPAFGEERGLLSLLRAQSLPAEWQVLLGQCCRSLGPDCFSSVLGISSSFLFERLEGRILDERNPGEDEVADWLLMKDTLNGVLAAGESTRAALYTHALSRLARLAHPEAIGSEMHLWRARAGMKPFALPRAGFLELHRERLVAALAGLPRSAGGDKVRSELVAVRERLSLDAPPGSERPIEAALLENEASRETALRLLAAELRGEVEARPATPEERRRFLSQGTLAATVYSSLLGGRSRLPARHKTLLYVGAMPLALLLPLFQHEAIHATDADRDRENFTPGASEEAKALSRYRAERKAYDGEHRLVAALGETVPGLAGLLDFYREHYLFHQLPVSDAWITAKYRLGTGLMAARARLAPSPVLASLAPGF